MFAAFHSVWVHLGPFRYCMKLGAYWAELEQLMQNFMPQKVSEFFATNAPDPPHWTLNSKFVTFRSVWVRLGLLCYDSKLSAKWAELVQLMQKFMPRSCIGCFRNERT